MAKRRMIIKTERMVVDWVAETSCAPRMIVPVLVSKAKIPYAPPLLISCGNSVQRDIYTSFSETPKKRESGTL